MSKIFSGLTKKELAEAKRKYHREVYLKRRAKDPDYQKKINENRKKWLASRGDEAKELLRQYNKVAKDNYIYNHGRRALTKGKKRD